MRYLFIHQNYPGQYLHLLRHLAAQRCHEILFITENRVNQLEGVRKIVHPPPRMPNPGTHPDVHEIELQMTRASIVAETCRQLKSLGFVPDLVLGHHGWGELLNIGDVWPDAPLLGYHEFYYHLQGVDVGFDPEFPTDPASFPRIRAKNVVNLLALENGGQGQTPTEFQLNTYPEWARARIEVLREGVNLDVTKPDPAARTRDFALGEIRVSPTQKLVTYVVRDLEPYRGFHVFMRALPAILEERKDTVVILVGGDGVSYGARLLGSTWRERMIAELGPSLDLARVHFPGRVPYADFVRLLQRSDAHVYLTYPFVASWSLREALATGCALVASDTAPVQEFVSHRKTGLLVPFLDPNRIATGVLDILSDTKLATAMRGRARRWAETHLRMDTYLAAFEALMKRTMRG